METPHADWRPFDPRSASLAEVAPSLTTRAMRSGINAIAAGDSQTTHRPHAAHVGQAPPPGRPAAETALVGRGIDWKVWMRHLMPDEAAFVACLLNSGTLDAALAAAYASDATSDDRAVTAGYRRWCE